MRFVIFVIYGSTDLASSDEMQNIGVFNEKLKRDGHWIAAEGIRLGDGATLIDNRNGKGEISSGSLVTSGDNYNGFWLIEAKDEAEAQALALEGSKACNRRVELRPYL